MATRGAVGIVSQLGVESTRGTAVGASKRLPAMSINLNPQIESRFSRTNGFKNDTTAVISKKWTTGNYSGPVTYGEMVYPLSGLYGGSVGSVVTNSYTWTFAPSSSTADAFKTFTFQTGDSTAAQQINFGYFASMQLTWNRSEMSVSGDLGGQFGDQTATLTATPTLVENIPATPQDVDVYINDTFAAIGTTKITSPFEITINIGAKLMPKWVLNTTYPSFADVFEQAYDITISVRCEADAQQRSLYDAMITDRLPTRYLRFKSEGLLIGGALNYLLQGDFAVKLENGTPEENIEGVYGWRFDFRAVHDSSMGASHSWLARNKVSAL